MSNEIEYQEESNERQMGGVKGDFDKMDSKMKDYLKYCDNPTTGSSIRGRGLKPSSNNQIAGKLEGLFNQFGNLVTILKEMEVNIDMREPDEEPMVDLKPKKPKKAAVKEVVKVDNKGPNVGPYTRPKVSNKEDVKVVTKTNDNSVGSVRYIPRRSLFDIDHDINGRIIEATIFTGRVVEEIPTREVFIRDDHIEYTSQEVTKRSDLPDVLKKKKISKMTLVFDVDFK